MLDVLIIDDSAAVRKVLQRVLREADVPVRAVFEARYGTEAIETFQKENIGLILSEMNMAQSGGLEFVSRLKADETWKKLPAVMASTQADEAKVLETWQLGVSGYVRRPQQS